MKQFRLYGNTLEIKFYKTYSPIANEPQNRYQGKIPRNTPA